MIVILTINQTWKCGTDYFEQRLRDALQWNTYRNCQKVDTKWDYYQKAIINSVGSATPYKVGSSSFSFSKWTKNNDSLREQYSETPMFHRLNYRLPNEWRSLVCSLPEQTVIHLTTDGGLAHTSGWQFFLNSFCPAILWCTNFLAARPRKA